MDSLKGLRTPGNRAGGTISVSNGPAGPGKALSCQINQIAERMRSNLLRFFTGGSVGGGRIPPPSSYSAKG